MLLVIMAKLKPTLAHVTADGAPSLVNPWAFYDVYDGWISLLNMLLYRGWVI